MYPHVTKAAVEVPAVSKICLAVFIFATSVQLEPSKDSFLSEVVGSCPPTKIAAELEVTAEPACFLPTLTAVPDAHAPAARVVSKFHSKVSELCPGDPGS